MLSEPVIRTRSLTKRYGQGPSTLEALCELDLEVSEGECMGYIGPNGAGKSTTIKILATLLRPTWGEARVCGHTVGYENRLIRPLIGYVPDEFGTYEDMVVQEYLEFFAAAYGLSRADRIRTVGEVLELTDLAGKRDALVDSLSRGMKQRLSIARVLLHDPRLLLMDEPASGLDPRARIEMRELLKELVRMGKTILISSHILPELADLCTTVGVLEKGKLIYKGPVDEITRKARTGTMAHVSVLERQADAALLLARLPIVAQVREGRGQLDLTLREQTSDLSSIAAALLEGGFRISQLREEEVNLETAFMRLTRGLVQ